MLFVAVCVHVLQEQEAVAASVMASLPQALQQQGLGQLQVTLQGLSTFRNQVCECVNLAGFS
jgi:hypothetical protein